VILVNACEKVGLADKFPDSSPRLLVAAPEADVGEPNCGVENTIVPDVGMICKLLKLTVVSEIVSA
jgi:hypothetical protein